MNKRFARYIAVLVACSVSLLSFGNESNAVRPATMGQPLSLIRDVDLPGEPTRFDYQAVDRAQRLLYVAHLGDSNLDVLDLDTLHTKAVVANIDQVHGIALAPELGRVFASATGSDELVAIESATNRVISRSPTGAFPDGVAFDHEHMLVFVSNKDAGTLTVVNASTGKPVRTIVLGHEVGNVAYDEAEQLIYAATRPPDRLVAIDPDTGTIDAQIQLGGCDGAHGVYIDSVRQRAFVACERNRTLVTVDLALRAVTGRDVVGIAPDVIAYDAGFGRLYVASESGTVTTFGTSGTDVVELGEQRVAAHAHSVSVDPSTHRVFFPLEDVRGHPELRVMRPRHPRGA